MLVPLLALAALSSPQERQDFRAAFVDDKGAPVADVLVVLDDLRGGAAGRPRRSDQAGLVHLSYSVPGHGRLKVSASHSDYPTVHWLLLKSDTKDGHDLGQVVLRTAGTLTGSVTDLRGNVLSAGWRVEVTVVPQGRRRSREKYEVALDGAGGKFRIEGMVPGAATVSAAHATLELDSQRVECTVESGAETFVTLTFGGTDPGASLRLEFAGDPLPELGPIAFQVINAAGVVHERLVNLDAGGLAQPLLADLGPGPHQLVLTDPRLEPVERAQLLGGQAYPITLRGNSTLRLQVIDPSSGRQHTSYGLSIVGGRQLVAPEARSDPNLRIEGLLPGRQRLILSLPGSLGYTFETPALTSGAVTEFTYRLPLEEMLIVRCRDARDRPVEGVRVCLFIHPSLQTLGREGSYGDPDPPDLVLLSDSDGVVRFGAVKPERHMVRAYFSDWVRVELETGGAGKFELASPATGEVDVSVLLPPGLTPEQLPYFMALSVQHGALDATKPRSVNMAPVTSEGFPTLTLPVGTAVIGLGLDMDGRPSAHWGSVFQAEVQVRPGQRVEHAIDLRKIAPARLEVDLTVDGAASTPLWLEARPSWMMSWSEQDGHRSILAPAGPLTIVASGGDGRWVLVQEVQAAPGKMLPMTLDVPLVRRTLRVLDPQGRPLVQQTLKTTFVGFAAEEGRAETTDAEGRVTIARSPWKIRLVVQGYRPFELEYSAELPAQVEVRLQPDEGN